jgi:hypothetical protein
MMGSGKWQIIIYIYNYQGFIPIYGNLFLRNMTLNHGGCHLGVGARDAAGWSDVVAHGAPGGFGPATRVMPGAHLKTSGCGGPGWCRDWALGTHHLNNATTNHLH